uniref:Thyroglobulin type-1 domain-containing protein n=1 Tax=Elaeophora elaphi TaxID=1147741 RepID=A0A158Q7V6_9BILA
MVNCLENTYVQNPIIATTTDRSCRRPPGCELHCPFGYQTGVLGACLCICLDIPCPLKACAPTEYCRHNGDGTAIAVKPSECPRLFGGACIDQCSSDNECGIDTLKCCSNGCGRECVVALIPQPIVNSLSIHPLQVTGYSNRIGKCPLKNYVKNQNCVVECIYDDECPWVEKCCDNECGRVCTSPDKATDCIHLVSAVNRLPEKTLGRGYVPKCAVDGQFENIQCDDDFCWCVDEKGIEIIGTKTARKTGSPNCLQRRNCKAKLCPKLCSFGVKTDHDGCPLDNCKCRDLCEEVKCMSDIDMCQMVEPDCEKLPCQPIGFNGFGFCCSLPQSVLHSGSCVPVLSRSHSKSSTKIQQMAECPEAQQHYDLGKCRVECKADEDCSGIKKCCTYNCSSLCLFPTKVTACLHELITHEIFGNNRVPKCNSKGNYERIQCDDRACYCVDTVNGVPDVCLTDGSPVVVPPVLCKNKQDCPENYWCNNIGVQSKGLCCPLSSKQQRAKAKCKSVEPFIEYNKPCDIRCRTDDECAADRKCCYDGCGTTCVQTSGRFCSFYP